MLTSVAEAEKIIARHARSWGTEQLPLLESRGCILREALYADRDFPPFDRVTMDGIAIRFERFAAGQRRFPVAGIQAAGAPPLRLTDPANCLEVMTGAMLPEGVDTVIRYEELRLENGQAELLTEDINFRQNLHFQGTDRRKGELLVPAGRQIAAPEIATAATVGQSSLLVARRPRVAIVSTGDELVGLTETPLPHQIRRSNAYALQAMLAEEFHIAGQLFHFADDKLQIAEGLREILACFDVVVLSGAVSAGKFDFVPEVLEELGVEKCFHQVAQRPGKPFWFGHFREQAVVFALPGNPVSTFLCAWRYLVPFLRQSLGQEEQAPLLAVLSQDVIFKPQLSYFLPVQVRSTAEGARLAVPVPGQGSGDLANLNDADAFLELPKGQDLYPAGTAFSLIPYR